MAKEDKNIYYCVGCGNLHPKNKFYVSENPLHANGVLPYCKDFIKKESYKSNNKNDNNIDVKNFQNILMQMNIPFLKETYVTALSKNGDVIGQYFRMFNSLPQNRGYTWKNSDFGEEENIEINNNDYDTDNTTEDIIVGKTPSELTKQEIDKLEEKWGSGYDINEYVLFEKRWNKLIDNYGRKTAMHVEGLKTYIRFRIKEELATAKGDVKEAKEWGQLASKAATDAKINVSQLSKSDISGGIDVLPQLFEAVESKVGIIAQLPKLLDQPYDDADVIIWTNVNYMRRLEGKSRVSYREIWDFYDEMLEEHCKQQGMSEQNIEEFKKTRRVPYRDLGEVYKEPTYEDGDSQ